MSVPVLVVLRSKEFELAEWMVETAIGDGRIPQEERDEYFSVIFTALHLRLIRKGKGTL